jgi:hypothetical protein
MAVHTLERPGTRSNGAARGLGARLGRSIVVLFAVLGLLGSAYVVGAAVNDIGSFDRTRGGYEPPYTGFTGTPIQRDEIALEGELVVMRGRVIDSEMSCTTGAWSFNLLGFSIPYRTVSERALVVHQPQVFCRENGFDTGVWDLGY